MEPMILKVRKVERIEETPMWIGTVEARSRERLAGLPIARISLQVRFQVRDPMPPTPGQLREMAYDEALRFLDIA